MGEKIDERASVPLTWLFVSLSITVSIVSVGSMWISTVNYRLSRIERHLGMRTLDALQSLPLEDDAEAKSK